MKITLCNLATLILIKCIIIIIIIIIIINNNIISIIIIIMGIYFYESGRILRALRRAKYNLTSKNKYPYKTEHRLIRYLLNGFNAKRNFRKKTRSNWKKLRAQFNSRSLEKK